MRLRYVCRSLLALGSVIAGFYCPFTFANELAQSFTLDGQVLQAGSDQPLLDANAKIVVDVLDPSKTCILYEEQQFVNTSATNGYYSIQIGSDVGSGKRTANDPHLPMAQIFQNNSAMTGNNAPGQTCAGGTFTPAAPDSRYFRITVTPSATNVADTLSPDTVLDSVPSAIVAQTLQGLDASSFLQVNGAAPADLTQANLESIFSTTNFPRLQALLSVPASNYLHDGANGSVAIPQVSGAPGSGLSAGQFWYDSVSNQMQYYNGTSVQILGVAGTGIASLTVGNNLTANGTVGGTLTSAGTIDLNTTGITAGTYTKLVVDTYGRATSGSQITGNDITSGTIGGTTAINTSGAITTTGNLTSTNVSANAGSFRSIVLNDAGSPTPNTATLKAPAAISTNYTLTLPTVAPGVAGSMLVSDTSGVLSWVTPANGTVTSITAGTGLTGGTISGTGTIGLANSGVTAGTYGSATVVPQITVNQQGQITSETDVPISGVAPAGAAGGDLAGTYPNPSVAKIQGTPVSSTAPTSAGEVLKYDGSTQYAPGFIGIADIRSTQAGNAAFFPLTCNAGQTLTYSAVTDTMSCAAIAISDSAITYASRAANTFFAAPAGAAGAPSFRTITATDLPANAYDSTYFKNGGNSFGAAASLGTADNNNLTVETNGAARITVLSGGNVGIGTTSPSAALQLKAGASSAGGAPMKLTAGTSLSSPEPGAIEYDGTSLFYTDDASARHTLAAAGAGLTALSGDVSASGSGSVTATVTRVNGVTYGSSPSANTVPVVTSSNTVTYETLPNAALTNSSITLGTTNVTLGATASSLVALSSVGLGVNGTTTGTLTMANGASSGATTTVQPSTLTATAWTMTLPSV